MKTKVKALVSVAVIAFFLLLAWACSVDDYFSNYTEFLVLNQSDSCTVSNLNLTYQVRRDDVDTLWTGLELLPGDSLSSFQEILDYKHIHYTCNCPNDTFLQQDTLIVDTLIVNELSLDCD